MPKDTAINSTCVEINLIKGVETDTVVHDLDSEIRIVGT